MLSCSQNSSTNYCCLQRACENNQHHFSFTYLCPALTYNKCHCITPQHQRNTYNMSFLSIRHTILRNTITCSHSVGRHSDDCSSERTPVSKHCANIPLQRENTTHKLVPLLAHFPVSTWNCDITEVFAGNTFYCESLQKVSGCLKCLAFTHSGNKTNEIWAEVLLWISTFVICLTFCGLITLLRWKDLVYVSHVFQTYKKTSQKEKPVDYNESPKWMQGPFWKIPIYGKI